MAKPLKPVHVWACAVDGKEVVSDGLPEPCEAHNVGWVDIGWRVGEHSGAYSWYSTLETALRDKRC